MPTFAETDFVAETQNVTFPSLTLDCGVTLLNVDVAYETYGTLNASASNAILVLHAFSGDAHAAGISKETGQPGWWAPMIGPGLAFDTNRYFVISSNVLGGCRGTTGPGSTDPATGQPYGMRFPVITIADMVRLQKMLIEHLGIECLLAVAGGSMGGMQALEWAVAYPDAVSAAVPIATTARHSAQQIAFNEVGRQAIMADPDWNEGNYYDSKPPARGLSVARMIGHITYMSDASMRQKFGRRLRDKDAFGFDFSVDFEVESYLRYRGSQFVSRFDANSYLYITKAMDYFDLAAGSASLAAAFDRTRARFLVISFTSDWLYPTYQSRETVSALRSRNLDVAFCELTSSYGHDAFLLEARDQSEMISGFLASVYRGNSSPPRRTAAAAEEAEAILSRLDYAMIA
ncbi:MAG: homoserine O-acetyltransferase MetX, partial [Bryobacteraceae bacterium]